MERYTVKKDINGQKVDVVIYQTEIGNLYVKNVEFLGKAGVINREGGLRYEKIGDIQLWSICRTVFDAYRKTNKQSLNGVLWRMRQQCQAKEPRQFLLDEFYSHRNKKDKEGLVSKAFIGM